jgi:hypothetical protein
MDDEIQQMLEDLPSDLLERGWRFVPSESRESQQSRVPHSAPWYRAVYRRPFDDRLDSERGTSATYDKLTRHQIVRISTNGDHSLSWSDARQDAIQRMQTADAKRGRDGV